MIDDLKSMAVFAEVVKFGSFRQAANSLDLSPSVISYHISQLEQKLNAPLLYRSTRSLSLTSQGEDFFQHVQSMLSSAQMGLDNIQQTKTGLSGKLSLALSTALIYSPIADRIIQFISQHPQIELSIEFTDEPPNLIASGIDLAISSNEVHDRQTHTKSLGHIEQVLVCSTAYLAEKNMPIAPQNLLTWRWLRLSKNDKKQNFIHQKHANASVIYQQSITVNSIAAKSELALRGAGVAILPSNLAQPHFNNNQLVHLLADWQVPSLPLYASWATNIAKQSLSMQLLNFIQEIEYA